MSGGKHSGTIAGRQNSSAGLLRVLVVGTGRGLLAGLAAGAICGVGARVAMRIVAVAEGSGTAFTIEGTLGLVIAFAVIGAPMGIIFVAVRRWLPGPGLRSGLVFGVILLLAVGVPFFMDARNEGSVFSEGPLAVGIGLSAMVLVAYGPLVEAALARLGR